MPSSGFTGGGGGQSYPATSATLGGSAALSSCSACADGEKVSDVGGGNGTVTFKSVSESSASGGGSSGAPGIAGISG